MQTCKVVTLVNRTLVYLEYAQNSVTSPYFIILLNMLDIAELSQGNYQRTNVPLTTLIFIVSEPPASSSITKSTYYFNWIT